MHEVTCIEIGHYIILTTKNINKNPYPRYAVVHKRRIQFIMHNIYIPLLSSYYYFITSSAALVPSFVAPTVVDPELVDHELVDPELVDPTFVDPELVAPALLVVLGFSFALVAHALVAAVLLVVLRSAPEFVAAHS